MSESNIGVVERAIAAVNARDVTAYLCLCHPDFELVTPLAPLEGTLRGASGIREFFSGLAEATSVFHFDVESLEALGNDRVLAVLRRKFVSRRGIPADDTIANVYELERGKLRRVHVYRDRNEALKAAATAE